MKATQVLLGLGAGVATGVGVVLMNREKQNHQKLAGNAGQPTGAESELNREVNTIKQNVNDIINYVSQIKSESTEFGSTIGDEVKKLIGNFQSDINPNIERLQSHIENLQNRGEEISHAFDKEEK
ncbi:YtxH domain-containing protein [Staphylococcus kloosii]|uniref:YtxH domain-containing protein n=1 Tax=Staphylococcus kloosii TaxID=29384 RepID=UPI0028A3B5B1|nr:YtxH domain-containing protein [Staphylococcus kloosii]MDT3960624.1 YtxH domain-containing protein [Staphylococcus kloosii]